MEKVNVSNLNKFDEKLLKCIVTTRPSTLQILKDHGAIIVYQNNDYNNLYLGDEFIAAGRGFKNQEYVILAEEIIDWYTEDSEESEEGGRFKGKGPVYIYGKLEDFEKKLEEAKNELNANLKEFKDTYTVFVKDANGNTALLNDVFDRDELAQYDDIEIINITKTITYNNNKTLVINDINENVVNLPIGTLIKFINYNIKYKIHDSGGIDEVKVSYYDSLIDARKYKISSFVVNNTQYENNVDINGICSLDINLDFNEYNFLVSRVGYNEDIKIIPGINLRLKGTQDLKRYPKFDTPEFKEKYPTFELYSKENIITPHEYTLDPLYIHPVGSLKYMLNKSITNSENRVLDFTLITELNTSVININTNSNSYVGEKNICNLNKGDLNSVYIDVNNQGIKEVNLLIPYSFKLHSLYYITETGEYNLSGAVGILKESEEYSADDVSVENVEGIKIKYNECDNKEYSCKNSAYIKYTLYKIIISEGNLKDPGKLRLLIYTTENFTDDIYEYYDVSVKYSEDEANEHNGRLPGALSSEPLTQEQALSFNRQNINNGYNVSEGAVLTQTQINKYNSRLEGAVKTGDTNYNKVSPARVKAVEPIYWDLMNDENFNSMYWLTCMEIDEDHTKPDILKNVSNNIEYLFEPINGYFNNPLLPYSTSYEDYINFNINVLNMMPNDELIFGNCIIRCVGDDDNKYINIYKIYNNNETLIKPLQLSKYNNEYQLGYALIDILF